MSCYCARVCCLFNQNPTSDKMIRLVPVVKCQTSCIFKMRLSPNSKGAVMTVITGLPLDHHAGVHHWQLCQQPAADWHVIIFKASRGLRQPSIGFWRDINGKGKLTTSNSLLGCLPLKPKKIAKLKQWSTCTLLTGLLPTYPTLTSTNLRKSSFYLEASIFHFINPLNKKHESKSEPPPMAHINTDVKCFQSQKNQMPTLHNNTKQHKIPASPLLHCQPRTGYLREKKNNGKKNASPFFPHLPSHACWDMLTAAWCWCTSAVLTVPNAAHFQLR